MPDDIKDEFEFVPEPVKEEVLPPLPDGVQKFDATLTRGLKISGHFIEAGTKVGEVHMLFGIEPAKMCANVGRNIRLEYKE